MCQISANAKFGVHGWGIRIERNRNGEREMPEGWLRRQAVQITAQLPENPGDALRVLDLSKELVRKFLVDQSEARRLPAEVVPFSAASNSR